jgi:chromosome segregation ATPase
MNLVIKNETVAAKLNSIEGQLKDLMVSKDATATEIHEISLEISQIKSRVDFNSVRTDETSINLKEMVNSVSSSLRDFAKDFKDGMKDLKDTMAKKHDDIEERLLDIERQRWKVTGGLTLMAFIISVGILVVVKYLPGYQVVSAAQQHQSQGK